MIRLGRGCVPKCISIGNIRFNSHDSKYLVLNPENTGVIPRSKGRRNKKRVEDTHKNAILQDIAESQRILLADQNQPSGLDVVMRNIESLRPNGKSVSEQTFDRLSAELTNGYKKQQLSEYLSAHNIRASRNTKKRTLVSKILSDVWKLQPQYFAFDTMKERIIDLSERDFVLCLAHDGQILRKWAKNGARVTLLPAKRQLVIKSTQSTYEWIAASLLQMQEGLKIGEVSLEHFTKLVNLDPQLTRAIQWLSHTYFEPSSEPLIIYSSTAGGINSAKRLLLQLFPQSELVTNCFLYDVNSENTPNYSFYEFDDLNALQWFERANKWFRWEQVKFRTPRKLAAPVYATLESAEFSDKDSVHEELKAQIFSRLDKAANSAPQEGALTLTATPGYLLHEMNDTIYPLPNVAMKKLFCTNIPYVTKFAGQLGSYSLDVAQEVGDENAQDIIQEVGAEDEQDIFQEVGAEDEQDIFQEVGDVNDQEAVQSTTRKVGDVNDLIASPKDGDGNDLDVFQEDGDENEQDGDLPIGEVYDQTIAQYNAQKVGDAKAQNTTQEVGDVKPKEVHREDSASSLGNTDAPKENDPWSSLLESVKPVYPTKRKELKIRERLDMVQLKLTPNLFELSEEALSKYPNLEIWCPIRHGRVQPNEAKAVKVTSEDRSNVSLASDAADLVFSAGTSEPLEKTDELNEYIQSVSANTRGIVYVPPDLIVDSIPYKFSESNFQTCVELSFNGHLLQLVSNNSEKIGGRRVEANLVLHYAKAKDYNPEEAEKFIDTAIELVHAIGDTSVESLQ